MLDMFGDKVTDAEKTEEVLKRVAEGVWNKIEGGMRGHFIVQCAFCCRGPHAEHSDWCPVKLAKEVINS